MPLAYSDGCQTEPLPVKRYVWRRLPRRV